MHDERNGKKYENDGLFYGTFCNIDNMNQNKYG
jgi:hypothetical protein